ncbi:hypothetical protein [Maridesulfovibrio sp.]|uniref:hypothetical protein n=1 Tax=Maridesulfovibrio sp. TaxID=2795000 RepID=UPI0039F05FA9
MESLVGVWPVILGIDLDNTIICYDNSLHGIAHERGLISSDTPKMKRVIRDQIRAVHGEMEWQKLQVAIYGTHIDRAELMPGVWNFLLELKERNVKFQIVSHKTRYPNCEGSKENLHAAAMNFLRQNNFFAKSGLGITEEDVFFLPTRAEKIETISKQKYSVFIDDLKELYLEPNFPAHITKILFSAEPGLDLTDVTVLPDFTHISEFIFKRMGNANF